MRERTAYLSGGFLGKEIKEENFSFQAPDFYIKWVTKRYLCGKITLLPVSGIIM